MNKYEQKYLDLLREIIDNGAEKKDRTGIGTKSIFGTQLRFSLENNTIPLLTTKRMFAKGVIEELLFFIRGDTDTKKLEAKGVNIWKGNTSREFLDKRNLHSYKEGQMGPMYGAQWRKFGEREIFIDTPNSYNTEYDYEETNSLYHKIEGVDQLSNALHLIKTDPDSRRILVSAYNPQASDFCVLEPCHMFFQFYVDGDNLSCQWYQRSVDAGLGLPFNIASYAILTHLMAKAAGLKAKELIFAGGDTHVYLNHVEPLKEQLKREPYEFPTLNIKKEISSIEDMERLDLLDFQITNYNHHPSIKMDMAV
jgi:thymidylate synthase